MKSHNMITRFPLNEMVYSNGYIEGFVFFQRFSCHHEARMENPDLFTVGMGMVYDDHNSLVPIELCQGLKNRCRT